MISPESRPRLARKARVRRDRKSGGYLLLAPEKGLALNGTAAAILHLCTGEYSVSAIVDRLVKAHPGEPRTNVEGQVIAFLEEMVGRCLVVLQ